MWEGERTSNIEHRTPNIELRSEERMKSRPKPALQRLNPDLPVEAIEGAVEEREILNVGSVVAFGFAGTSFWILNGRGRSQVVPLLNLNSGGGGVERSRGRISVFLAFSPTGETGSFIEIERDFHGIRCFTNT